MIPRQYSTILFVIPITIIIHGPHFKIFTLVSKINGYVDLVFDIETLFEIAADLNTRNETTFLNRSIPLFPLKEHQLKPKEKTPIKVEMSFWKNYQGKG